MLSDAKSASGGEEACLSLDSGYWILDSECLIVSSFGFVILSDVEGSASRFLVPLNFELINNKTMNNKHITGTT